MRMSAVGAAQNFFRASLHCVPSKPKPGLLGATARGPAAQGMVSQPIECRNYIENEFSKPIPREIFVDGRDVFRL
jgi:hypothetical protein